MTYSLALTQQINPDPRAQLLRQSDLCVQSHYLSNSLETIEAIAPGTLAAKGNRL